jgi:mycothiol system anti-sigma-R factor
MSDCSDGKDECVEALQQLYLYIDGELTEELRVTIRRHLDDCPPCYEFYDFEAELRQVISVRCRDQVPESLRQRIAEALGSEPAEPPSV